MFDRKQLEIFRAVMMTGSVSRAGKRLNLSQPSVSRILRELEREFGCPLFTRQSKGVRPTPEAEDFFAEVERNYSALMFLEDAAAEIANRKRGSLNFGANAALSLEVVPKALSALGVSEHNIMVDWQIKTSRWVTEFAAMGSLKLGFAHIHEAPENVSILYEGAVPHMCIFPTHHALAEEKTSLTLKDLANERLIGLSGEIASELAARKIGHQYTASLTAELSISALLLAKENTCIPIVDAFTAHFWHELEHKKHVTRIISDLPVYRFALFEPVGSRRSLITSRFQEELIHETDCVLEWIKAFQ